MGKRQGHKIQEPSTGHWSNAFLCLTIPKISASSNPKSWTTEFESNKMTSYSKSWIPKPGTKTISTLFPNIHRSKKSTPPLNRTAQTFHTSSKYCSFLLLFPLQIKSPKTPNFASGKSKKNWHINRTSNTRPNQLSKIYSLQKFLSFLPDILQICTKQDLGIVINEQEWSEISLPEELELEYHLCADWEKLQQLPSQEQKTHLSTERRKDLKDLQITSFLNQHHLKSPQENPTFFSEIKRSWLLKPSPSHFLFFVFISLYFFSPPMFYAMKTTKYRWSSELECNVF